MSAAFVLAALWERRPLVHCLTNAVTIGRVADVLSAVGALPVMASAIQEVEEVVEHAQALLINVGTPTAERFEVAARAGRRASERQIPVVLDPVGAGLSAWRTASVRSLLASLRLAAVRGNSAEIAALANLPAPAMLRGVTADRHQADLSAFAGQAARRLAATVLVTGAPDVVGDGRRSSRAVMGPAVLARVVGAGDALTALVTACCAVEGDGYVAASAALTLFHAAARQAGSAPVGPGSFWPGFVDQLSSLRAENLVETSLEGALAEAR